MKGIKGQACDLCDSVEHILLRLDMPFENRTNRKPDPVFDPSYWLNDL